MSSLLQAISSLLREHGFALLIGTTVILLAFALVVHFSRSLSKKYMAASTAMLALLGYLIVAIVPMPRFGNHDAPQSERLTPPANPAEHLFATGQPTTLPMAVALPAADPVAKPNRANEIEALLAALEPTAENSTADASATPTALLWLAGLMAVGIAIFTTHLLLGLWRLRKILASSQPAPHELEQLVKLPAGTRLRIANRKVQPFCCGLLRPTIVLPHRLAQPSNEVRFVLLHERAHLTSGDTRARLLCALLRPVMFWHPLYWWLQRQLRFTSELLADDAAARGSVAEYVRCMMTLSTHPDPAAGGALVATIFRRRSELFRRLEMMLQRNEAISRSHSPFSRWTRAIASVALVAVCAGTFGVDDAVAQSPRSDAVREQVKELRAELGRLRKEIAELNATTHAGRNSGTQSSTRRGRFMRTTTGSGQNPMTEVPSVRGTATTTHTVKAGDTLAKIAKRYYGSSRKIDEIRSLNPNVDPRRLQVGAKLRVAPTTRHRRSASGVATGFGTISSGQSPQRGRRTAPRVATGLGTATIAQEPQPSTRRAPRRSSRTAQPVPSPLAQPAEAPTPQPTARGRRRARFPTPPGAIAPAAVPGATAPTAIRGETATIPGAAPRAALPGAAATAPARVPGIAVAPTLPSTGQDPRPTRRRGRRGAIATSPSADPTGPSSGGPAGPGTGGPAGLSSGGPAGPSSGGPAGPSSGRPAGPSTGGPAAPRRSRRYGTPPGPTGPSGVPNAEPPGPTAPSSGFAAQPPRPMASRARKTMAAGTTARAPQGTPGSPMTLSATADLITRCIELRGEVEVQEVHLRHAKSEKEHEIAEIRVRTKKLQYDAIRTMLKSQLQAAERELERTKKLRKAGFVGASELQATESKIKLLSRALR